MIKFSFKTSIFKDPIFWGLVCLLILSLPVHFFDRQIFTFLNDLHSPSMDILWISFTTLGDGLLICMILGCFLLINPRITFLGLLVFLLTSTAVHVLKYLMPAARPLEALGFVHITGPLLRWGSFPSGHTAAGFSATLVLMGYARGFLTKALILLMGTLIALSRIFVGAHFPSDVLWGTICTLTIYYLVQTTLWPKFESSLPLRPDFSNKVFKFFFYIQVAISLFGLLIYSTKFAEYTPAAIAISVGVIVFMCIKLFEIAPLSKNS